MSCFRLYQIRLRLRHRHLAAGTQDCDAGRLGGVLHDGEFKAAVVFGLDVLAVDLHQRARHHHAGNGYAAVGFLVDEALHNEGGFVMLYSCFLIGVLTSSVLAVLMSVAVLLGQIWP